MSQFHNKKGINNNNPPSQSHRKKNYSTSPDTVKCKKIGNYILSTTIGKGTFSKVKLGIHLPTQKKVAIKILDREKIKDESDLERISREIHILTLLRHPNIAQLYETITSERHIYIIMEYIEGRDLFQYIYSLQRLSELKASQLFRQLIACLEYIHTLGIVHRDIKPENILLNKQKTILKLVDFGLSNSYKHGDLLKTACGSPCYAAPEMISGKEYDGFYSDLWSCGVVLYCMLVGKLPFDDEDIKVLYYNIKSANYYMPPFLSNVSQDILRKILNTNPKRRITLEELKNHPFFLIGEKTPILKGLLIGIENIPVDMEVVNEMKQKYFDDKDSIDEEYIVSLIQKNNHNNITTIYYLLQKEKLENLFNANTNIKKISKEKIEENKLKSIESNKHNNSKDKSGSFGIQQQKRIVDLKIKHKKRSKNHKDEVSDINNNMGIITPNNEHNISSRNDIEWKKSDNLFNLSTIKKISFEKKKIQEPDKNDLNNIRNINNISNINNFNNINNINNNNDKGNRFNVLVINNFMSDQQSQSSSKNKNNSNILTINIGGSSNECGSDMGEKKIANNKLNINDIIINKLQKKRSNSRNNKRLTNINYNYKKNKTESILGQSVIVNNQNVIDINSFGNNVNENKFDNDENNFSFNSKKLSNNKSSNNDNLNNENNYKKLNTFDVKSFKICKKFILNSPEDSVINDDILNINNKTMNNIEHNGLKNKINFNNIVKTKTQNKASNNSKNRENNSNVDDFNKITNKKYITKLFDDNNDNLSYNEKNLLCLSNIGSNNYNNKSININFDEITSKNSRNKNTNYQINNKILKKIDKDNEYFGLNKSTNIDDNKKSILQGSDVNSLKSNYINEESQIKNINDNIINGNKNVNLLNNTKNININHNSKKRKGNNNSKDQNRATNYINNINIVKAQVHNNSKNKNKKRYGLNEKLSKLFKERFSVSLKKNHSKGKESYTKTSGQHMYSLSKTKSPSSYSQEKGDDYYKNNIRQYGNNKKIKQNYYVGLNNQKIKNNLTGTYNQNNLKICLNNNINTNNNYLTNLNSNKNSNNINIIRTNNFIKNNNIQKSIITPVGKNVFSNKNTIGLPANFSNVKRKIFSKKNTNNIKINEINSLIYGNAKINSNTNNNSKLHKIEFTSSNLSKEKNYGTMKSSSLNKKQHHSLKNNMPKSNKNGNKNLGLGNGMFNLNSININCINLNSKSKTKRAPFSLSVKK